MNFAENVDNLLHPFPHEKQFPEPQSTTGLTKGFSMQNNHIHMYNICTRKEGKVEMAFASVINQLSSLSHFLFLPCPQVVLCVPDKMYP